MSKNNKFQRVENPRENKNLPEEYKKKVEKLEETVINGSGEKMPDGISPVVQDAEDLEAASINAVTPEIPNREGVPVEERRMSFEEYRRQGIPPQYRGFFFSGR